MKDTPTAVGPDRFARFGLAVAMALTVWMPIGMTALVYRRYILGSPSALLFELTEFSILFITFLAAAWVTAADRHVRIEVVAQREGTRLRNALDLVSTFLGLAILAVLLYGAVMLTWENVQSGTRIVSTLHPPRWLLYIGLPVGLLGMVAVQTRIAVGLVRRRQS